MNLEGFLSFYYLDMEHMSMYKNKQTRKKKQRGPMDFYVIKFVVEICYFTINYKVISVVLNASY